MTLTGCRDQPCFCAAINLLMFQVPLTSVPRSNFWLCSKEATEQPDRKETRSGESKPMSLHDKLLLSCLFQSVCQNSQICLRSRERCRRFSACAKHARKTCVNETANVLILTVHPREVNVECVEKVAAQRHRAQSKYGPTWTRVAMNPTETAPR